MKEQRFISLASKLVADMMENVQDTYDVLKYLIDVGFNEYELINYFGFEKQDIDKANFRRK